MRLPPRNRTTRARFGNPLPRTFTAAPGCALAGLAASRTRACEAAGASTAKATMAASVSLLNLRKPPMVGASA